MDSSNKRTRIDEHATENIIATEEYHKSKCCRCHIDTVKAIVESIHEGYRLQITNLQSMLRSKTNMLEDTMKKLTNLKRSMETMEATSGKELELREGRISDLQRVIRNLRSDNPTTPSDIETRTDFPSLPKDINIET